MAIQRTPEEYKAAYLHHKSQGNLDKAKRVANLYRQTLKPQETDNAFEYSVDQAQRMGGKGLEAVGRATGIQGVEDYGTGVVEQQDKDIAKGGYTPKYNKSLRDTFNEDGVGAAVGWLGEKTAENSVSGGVALGGGLASAAVATVSAPAAAVIGLGTVVASGAMGAGEAAFEQEEKVGDYDAALATGQGVLIGILDKFGASKVIPASKLLKMTPKQIVDTLNKKGFANAAKEVAKKTGIEGVTEVAQEGVSMAGAASRGGEYTQKEVEDRSIDAFALGSTNAGVVQTVTGGASLVRGTPANLSDRSVQATFAQRLDALAREGTADGKAFNLSDVDTTSRNGVMDLMTLAHTKISDDIDVFEKALKPYLNVNDKNLSSTEIKERSAVKKLLQQSRNKAKSVVGQKDFEILKRLVGGTADGKRLIQTVQESQELTKVYNAGLKGGVSKFTDNASPFPQGNNYSGQTALTNALRAATFGGLAGSTAGATLPFQAGAFVGGRMIDGITGRRSKVQRYIKQNKDNQGLGVVTGLGEKDKNLAKAKAANEKAKAKSEEETQARRAKRFFLYTEGAPPVDNSPEDIYQRFTGMDRAGLEATIAEALQNPQLDPSVRKDLETLVESMKYGEKVSGFAVNYINLLANNNPEVAKRRVRPIEDPRGLATAIAVGGASGRPITPKEQGKLDNNAIVNQLKEDLEADVSLNTREREQISKALDKMLYDLGKNPVDAMVAIEKALQVQQIPQSAIAKYVTSYKDRVIQQQEARKGGGETTPPATPPSGSPILGVDGQPIQPEPQPPVVQPEPQPQPEPPVVQPEPPVDQPDPPITFPEPKPASVKTQTGKAKDILSTFEIGKEGSIFEDGVAGREQLESIADALNITVLISESLEKWNAVNMLQGEKNIKSTFRGWHRKDSPVKSTIHLKDFDRSEIGFLSTFAHEIAHAIESRALNHKSKGLKEYISSSAHSRSGTKRQYIQPNSFRELLNNKIKESRNKTVIRKEIDKLQDEMDIFFSANPELGSKKVRSSGYHQFNAYLISSGKLKSDFTATEQKNIIKQFGPEKGAYRTYKKNAAEFAVDPLWVYLVNPKLMKSELPNTAKLIQEFFNKPESDFPVTFQANPMMTILAIVLAGVAAKEREEEEKQQPPIQPLPEGQGILSV